MKDSFVLKSIGAVGFIISAFFTCVLFTSNSASSTSFYLNLGMALTLESCKVIFFYMSIIKKKLPTFVRYTMFVISILLVLFSMIASISYNFNSNNENKGKNLKTSDTYKRKVQMIESLKFGRDSLPETYITKRLDVNDRILALENSLYTSDESILEIEGFSAFLSVVYKITGIEIAILELILFTSLSVIFEICAMLLLFVSEYEDSKVENVVKSAKAEVKQRSSNPKQDDEIEVIPELENNNVVTKINDINFTNKPFTKKELKLYISEMYSTADDGTSKGYKKILSFIKSKNENLEFSQVKAMRIKHYLETIGVLKTEGVKTRILKKI